MVTSVWIGHKNLAGFLLSALWKCGWGFILQYSEFSYWCRGASWVVNGVKNPHKRCGYYPWVGKIPWRRKTATHSNILAWKIPWTEEPGRLRCKGLQRAGRTEQLRTPTGAAVTVWLIFIQSTQCICLFCSMTNGSLKVSDIALYTVWMRIIVYKNNS